MDEAGVEIERRTGTNSFAKVADLPADSVTYTDTGLADETDYDYRIRFIGTGGPSDYDGPVSVTVPIRAPIGPTVFFAEPSGRTTADLVWGNAATREFAVVVERRQPGGVFVVVARLPADSTNHVDTGLTADTEYEYRVYFQGDGGVSPISSVQTIRTDLHHYYVNPNKGNDMGVGHKGDPLRTLTAALAMAGAMETIQALPGTYDASHGEMFPLVVPLNVSLLGDEATQGLGGAAATEIVGSDLAPGETSIAAAIVLSGGGTVAGFRVSSGQAMAGVSEVGVMLGSGSTGTAVATVRNCTVSQCDTGIRFADSSKTNVLRDCRLLGNGIGILVEGSSGAGNLVEMTSSFGNDYGIVIRANGVDLGGGSEGGVGGNTFSCNFLADLSSNLGAGEIIPARNCFWDHAPPSLGTSLGTVDIVLGAAGIDFTGALLAPGACP